MDKAVKNNKGFSLVELILGVLILAIIVSPLLHSMITSANISNKGKNVRNATMAAQNVVEEVKSLGSQQLIDKVLTDPDYSFYKRVCDGASGQYSYLAMTNDEIDALTGDEEHYYIGIGGVTASTASYDAIVTLDAEEHYVLNAVEMAVYTSMDAVFTQPSGAAENPDISAARDIADQIQMESLHNDPNGVGTTVSYLEIVNKMHRTINIYVTDTEISGGGGVVTATIDIEYTTQYTESYSYQGETYFFTNTFTYIVPRSDFYKDYYEADSSASEVLGAMYFFYYPNYSGDTIVMYNTDDVEFSFFLIEQMLTSDYYDSVTITGEASISAKESSYATDVLSLSIYETHYDAFDTSPCVNVLTNVTDDITGRTSLSSTFRYRAYKGLRYMNIQVAESMLVAKEAQNRLYRLTVELFSPGSVGYVEGQGVYSLNASLTE